jgi:hypothetical protein
MKRMLLLLGGFLVACAHTGSSPASVGLGSYQCPEGSHVVPSPDPNQQWACEHSWTVWSSDPAKSPAPLVPAASPIPTGARTP